MDAACSAGTGGPISSSAEIVTACLLLLVLEGSFALAVGPALRTAELLAAAGSAAASF